MEAILKKSSEKPINERKWKRFDQALYLLIFIVLVGGSFFLSHTVSGKQALLYVLGALGGFMLYHARFGFTTAWRNFILYRHGEGIRAQVWMLLAASALFLPLLLADSVLGTDMKGNIHPVGISVLVGAFIFGIGMQMGDGCGSGTLYHIGGGDSNGLVALIGFIAGSVIATTHFSYWENTPHFEPISLLQSYGPLTGFLLQIVLLAAVYAATVLIEKKKNGNLYKKEVKVKGWTSIFYGPWPIVIGGLALAVLNAVILLVQGKPWGITSAFALWGAKVVQAAGGHPENWSYWQDPGKLASLQEPLYFNTTSVMNISLMTGALLAAVLAGRLKKEMKLKLPMKMIIGSLIGGVLMGYGARLSFGCNIGAFFSGIASFSIHGWLWFAAAFAGSIIGVKIRPYCRYRD
ncbi:YeeE/YedE family protein [Bacillus aerolatus]|uniref:YeeE/YedE family protein n=1 Tax=Bacillus aerolatus TaxID=2653354 RepID=A0A6I1FYQ1_9BACI|nr:YeeE/YedE family protein [Bacillus aerolatus]KAB7708258.1 YeeE/YedE family protein [Bacillus aerolatus]